MSLIFQKRIEDFKCANCGREVEGDGFTNHCPKCLWSKHVDIFPGDRKSECGGLMEPKEVLKEKGKFSVIHRCVKCDFESKNKISEKDDFEKVIEIAEQTS